MLDFLNFSIIETGLVNDALVQVSEQANKGPIVHSTVWICKM